MNLNNPLVLCGWAALFDGLRLVNEHDPEMKIVEVHPKSLLDFINKRRDVLVQHFFPGYQRGRKF
jgi:hypothetical protein